MSRRFSIFIYALTIVFFALFFIWPIVQTLSGAFVGADGRVTLRYVAEIFRNPVYLEGLRNAFGLALTSTLAAFALAMPLAWLADRFEFPGKKIFSALLLVPMILPPFVGAIGIKQILGGSTARSTRCCITSACSQPTRTIDWFAHSSFWGIVALKALPLYPILYLNVAAALANIDPAMEEAAENLGCTGLAADSSKITLPLIGPGCSPAGRSCSSGPSPNSGTPLMLRLRPRDDVQIFTASRTSAQPVPVSRWWP